MTDNWNQPDEKNLVTNLDIEFLKWEIGKHFPFYDLKYNLTTAAFFCKIDQETLEEKFDSLRKTFSEKGYIPMLRHEKGEHIIYVIQKPKKKEKSIWINISLLIAVIITTSLTGSLLYIGSYDIWNISNIFDIFIPENLLNGILLFALPLMSILFVHEMGHYYISKKHGVGASLPFFIPIPPIIPNFNIGTFGALISSRDPMPNKKALFDIGIAGPLAGFFVALPITIIGIANSEVIPTSGITTGEPVLGISFLFMFISNAILNIPPGYAVNMSIIAFAGWVGLLITSINLLPAGQLDGGHIFRAFLGEKQKYAGWIAVFIMVFTGWLFFAFIIIFMMGMTHPPPLNDATQLDIKRKALFFVALAILILCYIPYPIYYL
jgi:Zn-dependent protease